MKAKMFKRIGAMVMASVMMLAMGTTALADSGNTVSCGSGDNAVVIHKFQEPDSATGLPNNGTELDATDLEDLTPVKGIEFTISKATLNNPADSGSTDLSKYTLSAPFTGTTDVDGELTFEGLADGLYYVVETASATSTDVTGFFVNLPMTDPTGSGTLSTVHVYPKNAMTASAITKEVMDGTDPSSSTTADVGDDVTWLITTVVPGEFANADTTAATADYYKILDVLDKSLTYKSAVVKLNGTALTATTDYAIATSANANGTTDVEISFTPGGMAKLVAALGSTSATVTVEMTTTINEYAFDGMLGAGDDDYVIMNQASYEWKVGDVEDEKKTPDPDPEDPLVPQVIVTGLLIYKTDEQNNPLAGAKFKIANGNDDSASGYADGLEETTDANGYAYWKSADLTSTFGTNLGVFYALETAAPSGYAAISGYQAFAELKTGNVSAVIELQNFLANFELPLTGGVGTMMFTIGGLLLLAAAGTITLISRKKRLS